MELAIPTEVIVPDQIIPPEDWVYVQAELRVRAAMHDRNGFTFSSDILYNYSQYDAEMTQKLYKKFYENNQAASDFSEYWKGRVGEPPRR